MSETYYSIIGLSSQATLVEISNAIDKLRGDVLNCPISQQQLDEIASTLLDEEKRAKYDLSLAAASATENRNKDATDDSDQESVVNQDNDSNGDKNNKSFEIVAGGEGEPAEIDFDFLFPNKDPSKSNKEERRCKKCGAKLDSISPVCVCGIDNPYFKSKINRRSFGCIGNVTGTVTALENDPQKNSFCAVRFFVELIIFCVAAYFVYKWFSPIYSQASQTLKYVFIAGIVCIVAGSALAFQFTVMLLKMFWGNIYKPIPVRTARVVDEDYQEYVVRINGEFLLGNIQKQDYVSLWGLVTGGTYFPLFGRFTGRNKRGIILLEK